MSHRIIEIAKSLGGKLGLKASSGVARMMWASLCFSLMAACIKELSSGLPTFELVLWRNALSLPVLLLLIARRRISPWPWLARVHICCGPGATSPHTPTVDRQGNLRGPMLVV